VVGCAVPGAPIKIQSLKAPTLLPSDIGYHTWEYISRRTDAPQLDEPFKTTTIFKMRRGGLAALDRSLHSSAQYSSLSDELTSTQVNELNAQLQLFSSSLRQFAQSHRRDIVKDAEFRHAFQQMCAKIGVDPLGSSSRSSSSSNSGGGSFMGSGKLAGLWDDMLGLGDFQYALSIQIIDVCVSTRATNGGLIEMGELIRSINRLRRGRIALNGNDDDDNTFGQVTQNDILESIKLLKPLGSGYEAVRLDNDVVMVRSVPKELDNDSTFVIAALSSVSASLDRDSVGYAYITEDNLVARSGSKLQWTRERARAVLQDMTMRDGILWVDEYAHPARYYALSVLESFVAA
jgi:ESCRT-II complex subunit VPS22